ncbi:hypothetical protein D0Y65_000490 [Glycine soja]|uniref:RNase H type-1 domain-containing protein n=1 Tax=Glycine soja TaxID=3848 RepID=A0A445LZ24_GLYSO|nr:hypothetical protein D0Y65_000490 [Glycine soja]
MGRVIRWFPPPNNYIKINTDGSSFGNSGLSGYGGILRNEHGHWIRDFSSLYGFMNNINAKLVAIQKGLQVAIII